MTTIEINTTSSGGDAVVTMMPLEDGCTDVSSDTLPPLNFSQVTPSHFGISVQSFTPASSSSKCKDKSRLAELKARRRSSVGVRGSPTTNSLIRFMAQQKMMTPPAQRTPEFVQGSPFLSQPTSTLKQKMAYFQSLMEVEETEICDLMSKQDGDTRGCIETRDDLSDGECLDGEKENHPPNKKKRFAGPRGGCKVEISEASSSVLRITLKEQEVTHGSASSSETVDEAEAVASSQQLRGDTQPNGSSDLQVPSPETQQESFFELQSSFRQQPENPAATPPAQPASLFLSVLEMNPTGEDDSSGVAITKKKKKHVHFGGPLSPEIFDQTMPPSTPLQKGSTPARPPTPGGSVQLRSLLKTPQRSEPQSSQAQPDFSPTMFGASPTLVMPRWHRMSSVGQDYAEDYGKVPLLSFEEGEDAVTNDAESTLDAQPLNLNDAFQEESISQTLSDLLLDSEVTSSLPPQLYDLDEPPFLPATKRLDSDGPPAESRSRKKTLEPECESATEAPAQPSSRKRKRREQNEPVKRSSRTAAKSASEKMKKTSKQTWNKAVDRSLYGPREFASKNPGLSPITESSSFPSQPSSSTWSPSKSHTAASHQSLQLPDVSEAAARTNSCLSSTNRAHEISDVTLCRSKTRSNAGRKRRGSGPGIGPRPSKAVRGRRKADVVDELSEETEKETREVCGGQPAADSDTSEQTRPEPTAASEARVEPRPQTPPRPGDTSECVTRRDTPTSARSPPRDTFSGISAAPSNRTASPQKSAQSRVTHRRRSMYRPRPQEQEKQAEQRVASEVPERELNANAFSQQEHDSDTPAEAGSSGLGLAPWQADFNLEDVFKPVATRGQRSVRRSLRNQNNVGDSGTSSGLAWLPWTSPSTSKATRRRTCGRRVSDAAPLQPSLLD